MNPGQFSNFSEIEALLNQAAEENGMNDQIHYLRMRGWQLCSQAGIGIGYLRDPKYPEDVVASHYAVIRQKFRDGLQVPRFPGQSDEDLDRNTVWQEVARNNQFPPEVRAELDAWKSANPDPFAQNVVQSSASPVPQGSIILSDQTLLPPDNWTGTPPSDELLNNVQDGYRHEEFHAWVFARALTRQERSFLADRGVTLSMMVNGQVPMSEDTWVYELFRRINRRIGRQIFSEQGFGAQLLEATQQQLSQIAGAPVDIAFLPDTHLGTAVPAPTATGRIPSSQLNFSRPPRARAKETPENYTPKGFSFDDDRE